MTNGRFSHLFRLRAIWQTLSSLLRLRLRPEVDVLMEGRVGAASPGVVAESGVAMAPAWAQTSFF